MRRLVGTVACGILVLVAAPAYAAPVRHEAENAACDGLIESNHTGFSGTGFCNANNAVGAAVTFTVNASDAGTATLGIRYANGTTADRPATVNGTAVSFPGTGAWTTWATRTLTLQVNAGSNTIRLAPTTVSGLPNIDYLDFEVGGTPPGDYPNPMPVTGSIGAHDPAVVKRPNGSYLLAVTGNNLPLKTSTNRTSWSNAGVVWPNGAPWTTAYTGGSANLWAPDLSFHNGQYYLYYSASTFRSQRSAIFLATSPTGASGSWTNQGLIIESSTSVNYNAIDPNLVVDASGQWWLTFGSFWTGIKQIRLDPSTGRRSTTDTVVRAVSQRTTASGAVEAPTVYQRGGYYYLFVSFDRCCQGASSTYRVMVGRSTGVNGPYADRNGVAMTSGGGTQILAGHGSVHGPGHQAVLNDNGTEFLFYHYYADNGASFLGINRLGWDAAGWPYVY
ncbi:family 43 glycosylhydrolase [Allorhizocola rhizosphaerae]|uniref:family 43 glycosylhydrolase n=1 Tax=Allorhizocola rhizosphaerae TaxID=1872709 RepID=UPI001FEA3E67|nr:family 43 glycosylhydrolase [Allorhizocola rhizosphaerae]